MAEQAYTEPYQSEVRMTAVQILSKEGTLLYSILDGTEEGTKTNAGQATLDFIQFTESLNGHIEGELVFDGSRNQFEILQGRGNELLRLVGFSLAKNNDDDQTDTEIKSKVA